MTSRKLARLFQRAALGKLSPEAFLEAKRHLVPKVLYRYFRLPDPCLAGIRSSTITLRPADAQNDPFDSAFSVLDHQAQRIVTDALVTQIERSDGGSKYLQAIALQSLLEQPGAVSGWVQRQRGAIRICSFSERPDSILLWSHYAGGHTGLCVEYSTSGPGSEELQRSLYPVIYRESFADATDWLKCVDGTFRSFLFLVHAAMIKSQEWSYEREWRAVSCPADTWLARGPTVFFMPCGHEGPSAESHVQAPLPSAVILGARSTDDLRAQVTTLGEQMGVPVRQARLARASFQVHITTV